MARFADVLASREYRALLSAYTISTAGGALILAIGTTGVLIADAATFAASAALVLTQIRHRDAAAKSTDVVKRDWGSDLVAGARLVATTPRLRALIAFACISGLYI